MIDFEREFQELDEMEAKHLQSRIASLKQNSDGTFSVNFPIPECLKEYIFTNQNADERI